MPNNPPLFLLPPMRNSLNDTLESFYKQQIDLEKQNVEVQRTFASLKEITERYRDLWNHAPVGYIRHYRNGMIVAANERARELLGSGDYWLEKTAFHSYLDVNSRVVFRLHMLSVSESSGAIVSEMKIRKDEGEDPVWVRVESVMTSTGEFRSALIDISAQKAAEADRQEMARQLLHTQKMEMLHQLSGGVAHDFNNILQIIVSYGTLIRKDLLKASKDTRFIDALLDGANRGSDLTQRLLAFSRKSHLQTDVVDFTKIVENAMAMVSRTFGETIEIQVSLADEPLWVNVDSSLIQQVILNLCLNARDAMPNGGVLSIGLDGCDVERDVTVNGAELKAGRHAVLTVADTGIGMQDHIRERVFEPFFTTKGIKSGTGLGLSMVYGGIQQHGGSISVSSTPGEGSVFEVHLPVVAAPSKARPKHTVPSSEVGPATILFAEDEPAIRSAISDCLTAAGYDTLVATDGADAIRLFSEYRGKIHLLLTDAIMPQMSGRDITEEFHRRYPGAPVVFLTGHGEGVVDSQFVEAHDILLLQKPIQAEELHRAIAEKINASVT